MTTYYVNTRSGDDNLTGVSILRPFKTIGAALSVFQVGDDVMVCEDNGYHYRDVTDQISISTITFENPDFQYFEELFV